MKDRISALMKHMGMSQKDFANEICISPGTLSSIFSGRNKPTLNTLNNIHERFPEVNMDWLMNGKGEMFGSTAPVSPQFESTSQQMPPQTSNLTLEGKIFDRPSRKIAEIRVFYDDGTYEIFSPKL